MAGGGDDDVGMRRERLGREFALRRRMAHHGEVELVRGEPPQQLLAVADAEMHADAGMVLAKRGDDPREEVIARVDHGHVEEAALPRLEARDRLLRAADVAQDLAGARQHFLARLGEPEAAAHPLEELGVRMPLELAHLDRDRGWREVQLLGRARERQVP